MNLWNLFLRRLRRERSFTRTTPRNSRGQRAGTGFRPLVQALEDRTVAAADLFAGATVLNGMSATDTGSNVDATAENGEVAPIPGSDPINSVWWQWTAPADGSVEVNTIGSDFDTVLGVWTGNAVDALTLVDANDDYYDSQSRVVFQAVAGTTYHFSVDGYADATGNVTLNLAAAPANDNFADATPITVGSYTGNNTGATAEPNEPSTAGTSGLINSVWWKWTADASKLTEVNTFGSQLDTLLAVYTGDSLGTLQLVAANDDTNGLQSQVLFQAEAGTTYYIAVDGSEQFTGPIVLTLPETPTQVNLPPAVASGQSFTIYENSPGGMSVGTVVASDPNSGQTLTYSILDGNTSNAFSINRGTGEILVDNGAALDFETNPTFTLLVSVTDDGTPVLASSATVTVHLLNRHDPPIFQSTGPFFVPENSAAGTSLGAVLATDSDPGQTVSYSITGGNTGGAFRIDPATGAITVANQAALNYETTPSFDLTVTATDNDTPPLSTPADVVVFVQNANEAPAVADQTFSVDENSPAGVAVGTVAASDPDGGQTLTYSFVGDQSGAFQIDPATGRITVRDSSQLDFETTPKFVLTVQVADNGTPSMATTAEVTIDLNDVNEAAVITNAGPFRVNENVPAGTFVGTVTATDQDHGQTVSYAITSGNSGGAFAIDPSTGEITVANGAALDFETRPTFDLTVRVTDNGWPALGVSTSVVVSLNDVNDAPVFENTGGVALATINQSDFTNPGTPVSALLNNAGVSRVTDQDAGAKQGIAVVAADTTYGSWQFSTDGGSSWQALGPVSDGSARLLAADALTLVRFVPAAGYNGTVAGAITFRAWDQTAGANGGVADTSVSGGTSPFSVAAATASIKVRSALEQISLLSDDVRSLVSAGELSTHDGNQLLSKLENAKKQLEQGKASTALNQMGLFTSLVSGDVQAGDLAPTLGDDLLAKANAINVSIQN